MIEEIEEIDRVEWGAVTKIFLLQRTVYLIYGPSSSETAYRVRERLLLEGYDVTMLNEAVEYDAEKARKLIELALQHDC